MTAKIIDGKTIANEIFSEIKKEAEALKAAQGIIPGLAVILVGNNPASEIYVKHKQRICENLGFYSQKHQLGENSSTEEILQLVKRLNKKHNIHGILIQLPLPKQIDQEFILNSVEPFKDVDGFHPLNLGQLISGQDCFSPCTPLGIIEMLKREKIEIKGKTAVIIGRSIIVGKPLVFLLLQHQATVTICHSMTVDLPGVTRRADILIAAAGRPKLVRADMVKNGVVVIDVGMNRVEGKLCGDVDFEKVKEKASAITPVPGGVGPMTIIMLMKNTLKAANLQSHPGQAHPGGGTK